jgi:hypothetical protein
VEAERNRILSNLEGGGAAARGAARPRARWWVGIGLGALALVAGGAWLADGDAGDTPAEPAVVAAAPAPAKAAPAPAAAPAATINDVGHAAAAPPPKQQSLKEMLSAPSTPAPKASADVLSKALESPPAPTRTPRAAAGRSDEANKKLAQARIERKHAEAQAKLKKKAQAKEKEQAKAVAKTRAKAEAKTRAEARAKANARKKKAEPDSDVTLLQALVAHAQAHPEPARRPGIEAQLKQCEQSGKDGAAESCRARVCAGRAGTDAACKPARSARALSSP